MCGDYRGGKGKERESIKLKRMVLLDIIIII